MNRLPTCIATQQVTRGMAVLWWLGQAGFAFKDAQGRVVLMDPYLSDAVERLHGFKRLSLAPMEASEVVCDWVVLTHEHTDHLDPDALPEIARRNPACRFAAPAGCMDALRACGIDDARLVLLEAGRRYDLGGFALQTVGADHGEYSPTALSLLLDFAGVRILVTGDTALRPGAFKPLCDAHPDVLLPCINGTFGNMNHLDAATLAKQAAPQVVIPCHFWMFAEQGGDPGAFLNACRAICPQVHAQLLKPGESLTCRQRTQ